MPNAIGIGRRVGGVLAGSLPNPTFEQIRSGTTAQRGDPASYLGRLYADRTTLQLLQSDGTSWNVIAG